MTRHDRSRPQRSPCRRLRTLLDAREDGALDAWGIREGLPSENVTALWRAGERIAIGTDAGVRWIPRARIVE